MSIDASFAKYLLDRGLHLPVDGNYATAELKSYAERLHVLNKERNEIETKIALLAKAEDDSHHVSQE